ncbi:transcriptional regulator [Streptomyces chrestomyceticus]|uniref:transcriptional regulator n=1 Tax=Streptomyces chrestomyceticus TaxID=68185 RepID=UPI0019D2344E|nr:transcriptional regulator [Streptomyces chrestomyceticus]
MSMDFGRPPKAEANQELVRQRLKEAESAAGTRESLTVEWRSQPLHVEVIDMPVADLYYNPGTHRIRAQRDHDPELDAELQSDPWSDRSQEYLHHLLKALPADPSKDDPDFIALMESLRDFRQNDPGLITRDGVLVNGNTRRAALKELAVTHIRVGVLPESCTWDDVNAVELSLQLRKDHRREYSYINRLLAIDEQAELGRSAKDIARDFRIKEETCKQDQWILTCLRDLIERSRSEGTGLRLLDFEQHQEKLRELHRRYVKEARVSKANADVMKENRLAAMVLGFSKTDVRLIEPDFARRYLDQRLPEELKTESSAVSSVAIPGLGRSMKSVDASVTVARTLTDTVLRAKAVSPAASGVSAERVQVATRTFEAAKYAFEEALVPAGKDARIRKRKQAAPGRITDACQDIEQCITDLVMARASRSLDEEAFDEAVLKLRDSLGKLAIESARSIEVPGDGVEWLLGAVKQEE